MKKSNQKVLLSLNATPEFVWEIVGAVDGVEKWFAPMITSCRVEGNKRYCNLDNGDVLEEQFLVSNAEKTFVYTIHKQTSFPAENIVGIIRLEQSGEELTTLYWSVDLEVENEETFQALKENISGVYSASAEKLQELAQTLV